LLQDLSIFKELLDLDCHVESMGYNFLQQCRLST